jgi:hypothetical protein
VLIKIGNGASPEVFGQDCLINNEKAIQLTCTFSEDVVPNCDSPDSPADVLRYADSISMTVTGAGKLHEGDALSYVQWLLSGDSKNAEICVGTAGNSGAFKIACPVVLSEFSVNTTRPTTADCNITLQSHGLSYSDVSAFTS